MTIKLAHTGALITVPASSANLGPGFDSFGLALELRDEIYALALAGDVRVEVEGEGAGSVPTDERHLIARVALETLDRLGAPRVGLHLRCLNRIPHGRGLGSSAAAVVAGILIARCLISDPGALPASAVLKIASEYEGHPDNAAATIHGDLAITWSDGASPRRIRLALDERIRPVVFVPGEELATGEARAVLPDLVPHADAAFNAARSALLSLALTRAPELLFDATEDKLHQGYRAASMPASADALAWLRQQGYAAVVSGAGPSLLVLDWDGGPDASRLRLEGFRRIDAGIARHGCTAIADPAA